MSLAAAQSLASAAACAALRQNKQTASALCTSWSEPSPVPILGRLYHKVYHKASAGARAPLPTLPLSLMPQDNAPLVENVGVCAARHIRIARRPLSCHHAWVRGSDDEFKF